MKKYLVFDVGCIECGESSAVVGLYANREQAEKSAKEYITNEPNDCDSSWGRKDWHGQHSIEIFEIEEAK